MITWNIHKGIGGVDRRYAPERVVELLRHHQPDVALLQEVTEHMPRNRFDDQVQLLSEATGMCHVAFNRQHRFAMGGYGNLILSRFPLGDIEEVDLTVGWRKKRGAIQARAHVRHGEHTRSVMLHNLHLGLAGSERARQLERFLASDPFRGIHKNTPIVLGGDLNDLWGTLGPRFLLPQGFERAGALSNTFPAAVPLRPLDGLFVRGNVQVVKGHTCTTRLAKEASDHRPIIADLDLTKLFGTT
ncbi:MAG: endonuclease/exonuclease/phosphatase family protein [Polyangiaceae bacterium]|nr:endonuclease/exonuclease/phosphatase family protein [Polyangiaceae bacterium]